MPTNRTSEAQLPALLHWQVARSRMHEVQHEASLGCGLGATRGGIHAALRDIADAVADLLTVEIARARRATMGEIDRRALDEIQATLGGTEWNADTASAVAEIVRRTGRTIADVGEG
jgi:hypothetical protein